MKKGFTLLEVLVALSVLAIFMLGIYSVVNQSILMADYAQSKHIVVNKGFERVLKHMHYPRISLAGTEKTDTGELSYIYKRESSGAPGIVKVTLSIKSPSATASYEYFERSR